MVLPPLAMSLAMRTRSAALEVFLAHRRWRFGR